MVNRKKNGCLQEGRFRLNSKRLSSGKVQVKFEIAGPGESPVYGYLLAEPGDSLREVVWRIGRHYRLEAMGFPPHLCRVGRQRQDTTILLIK